MDIEYATPHRPGATETTLGTASGPKSRIWPEQKKISDTKSADWATEKHVTRKNPLVERCRAAARSKPNHTTHVRKRGIKRRTMLYTAGRVQLIRCCTAARKQPLLGDDAQFHPPYSCFVQEINSSLAPLWR